MKRYETPDAKARKGISKVLFEAVQWTWGLPVNLVGGIVYLICKKKNRQERFCNAYITHLKRNWGGLSLGEFIFMCEHDSEKWTYDTRIHEYGHTVQCLLLGPLYWLVVALPSSIWCNFFEGYRKKHNVSYYKLYCESWANSLGQKWSGLKQTFSKEN